MKQLSSIEVEQIYQTYMVNDFPKEELKPLASILNMMEKGIYQAVALFEKDTVCAYGFFVLGKQFTYGLLDYFAVVKEKRGQGIGHRFFAEMAPFMKEHFPMAKAIYIECEDTAFAKNENERVQRMRRIAFYEDNQAQITPLKASVFGVEYVILRYVLQQEIKKAERAEEVWQWQQQVDAIYQKMFKKEHYEQRVKWKGELG